MEKPRLDLDGHLQDAAEIAGGLLEDLNSGKIDHYTDEAAWDVQLACLDLIRAIAHLRQEQVEILSQEATATDPGPSQEQRL